MLRSAAIDWSVVMVSINRSTVEPLNKGHFGSVAFVFYSEVVL